MTDEIRLLKAGLNRILASQCQTGYEMSEETGNLISVKNHMPQLKKLAVFVSLLIGFTAISALMGEQSWRAGGVTILWPTNGFLIAWLLCEPRREWPVYLALGGAADLALNFFASLNPHPFYLSFCNMLEVWVAAVLLYRTIAPHPDLTRKRQLKALLLYGVVVAPAIAAAMASLSYIHGPEMHTYAQLLVFRTWLVADALGIATVTPLYLAFRHRAGYKSRSWFEAASLFLLIAGTTVLVFGQSRYPLLFLLLPLLLLIGVRMGLAASALALIVVTSIGGLLTTWGYGPTNLIPHADLPRRDLALQVFIAVSMLMLYILEVVMAESNRLQINLKASESRFRLLAESSRDIIVMTDLEGRRNYVSPAASEVLGWQPDDMLGGSFRDIVHPKDAAAFEQMRQDCVAGKPVQPLAYRCRTKNGDYRWVECNPRLYCDPVTGEPAGSVSVIRDIADRKKSEDELARAFLMVENLASIDGLTGIANRRRFDETLDREWRRAVRDGSEISIALLDVDQFKRYNDLYGHLSGDDCLRQIADSIRSVVTRAADLVARYGGEEFAVILPNTGREGALELCREMLAAVRRLNVPHDGNPHKVVTVSAGCVTCIADDESSYLAAMQAADDALYRAKALGRNRIEVAAQLDEKKSKETDFLSPKQRFGVHDPQSPASEGLEPDAELRVTPPR